MWYTQEQFWLFLSVTVYASVWSYYAKLRQQEMERERELAEKYRDRARERRDGFNKDYEETELISTTANYRAVGPTAEAWVSSAICAFHIIYLLLYIMQNYSGGQNH